MVVLTLGGCRPQLRPSGDDRYLVAAIEVGAWLQAQSTDGSAIPDRIGESTSTAGLGSGASGRAVFFAELYAATSDSAFLRSALRESEAAIASGLFQPYNLALYSGLSGVAFSIAEVARIADDVALRDEALELFHHIASAAPSRGGNGWGDVYDVLGGWAGIGLALLYAFERFGDAELRDAAIELGDSLLVAADSVRGGQLRWFRGAETPYDLPNFSHGTAGVGYFLSRLAASTGAERFGTAVSGATSYLDSVADTAGGLFLVPYGVPNEGFNTPYDIGWAHGPAGTALLYFVSWNETGDPEVRARLDANVRTLLASGVPGPSSDTSRWKGPFPMDRRFGTSGTAAALFRLGGATATPEYLDRAFRIVDDMLDRASTNSEGTFWDVPLYGFQPGDGSAVFTGYFYGASGFGLTLLEAHYNIVDRERAVRFPDDPFS